MIESIEQGRKEDGNRSIADKIIKRLHDLEMNVDNNNGRWVWELLQNAKDSIVDSERKVSIKIELKEDFVEFKHNGTHFSEKDIRGLINQISSKVVEENEKSKNTGKFGTGFLTTHLLSKVVDVKSIIETIDGEFYRFSFSLDRNGKTTNQLIPKIEEAWKAFQESTEGNKIKDYDENDFNTSFKYKLETKKQKDLATKGIDEFYELIPLVLAFIPKIESVRIIDKINNLDTKFENTDELEKDLILNIIKTENNIKSQIKILIAKENDISIACIIKEYETGYKILNLKSYPKLFCDFPLIGTEEFHFPVIVNSFYFNPLTERDGVWLYNEDEQEVRENRKIIERAVKIYEELLTNITELDFYDYLNLCNSKTPNTNEKSFNEKWYIDNIQKPLRDIISKSKVVETENGDKVLLKDVYFPDPELKKEERVKIWKFSSDLKVNTLPAKRHIQKWSELIWKDLDKLDIVDLVADLRGQVNITKLMNTLEIDESKTYVWLNNCIEFILEIGGINFFNDNMLIPNQEGIFNKRKELSKDEIKDETIKEIAALLGHNYSIELINNDIFFEDSYSAINLEDVAKTITQLINDNKVRYCIKHDIYNKSNKLIFEKNEIVKIIKYDDDFKNFIINPIRDSSTNYIIPVDDDRFIKLDKNIAIRKLTEWFDCNEEKGKLFFSELYSKREKLFVDTIEDKENLYSVLKSKTPLSELAEVVKAIDNDPEILNIIARRQQEQEEEKDRNEMGENIEKVLAETLIEYGFEVKKETYGKDLVITLKKYNRIYFVEVKSTSRESYVSLTPFQAKTAVAESENYALCVILKRDIEVNKEYIIENSNFVVDIGKKLNNKVSEVIDFETSKEELAETNEDIDLFYENDLVYKYKISDNIWTNGKSFDEFIEYINNLGNV